MYCPICGKKETCRTTSPSWYIIDKMKLVSWICIECNIDFLIDKSKKDIYEKGII